VTGRTGFLRCGQKGTKELHLENKRIKYLPRTYQSKAKKQLEDVAKGNLQQGKTLMRIKVGEFVVFSKLKTSSHPSPRAKAIRPAQHGEYYSYIIDKFWKVVQVFDDETIEVETRRGKRHRLNKNTPLMRKAGLLHQLLSRHRFF